ncbi:hypothetical protein EDB87DRAFT_1688949 [Lactarius vividus]|nr:hypothetical protein EDB87DRAFT_1688949 [Lactarius vividus]
MSRGEGFPARTVLPGWSSSLLNPRNLFYRRHHLGDNFALSSRISVLSFAAVPVGVLATPLSLRRDDMPSKHSWNAHLSHPPSDTAIDLSIVLKPHGGSALIDALYEFCYLRHPKHVLSIHSHSKTNEIIVPTVGSALARGHVQKTMARTRPIASPPTLQQTPRKRAVEQQWSLRRWYRENP